MPDIRLSSRASRTPLAEYRRWVSRIINTVRIVETEGKVNPLSLPSDAGLSGVRHVTITIRNSIGNVWLSLD